MENTDEKTGLDCYYYLTDITTRAVETVQTSTMIFSPVVAVPHTKQVLVQPSFGTVRHYSI